MLDPLLLNDTIPNIQQWMSSFVLQKESDHEIGPGGGGIHQSWNFDFSANFGIPKMIKIKFQVLESNFRFYVNQHKSMGKF